MRLEFYKALFTHKPATTAAVLAGAGAIAYAAFRVFPTPSAGCRLATWVKGAVPIALAICAAAGIATRTAVTCATRIATG